MNIDGIVFWGEDFEIGMNWGLIFGIMKGDIEFDYLGGSK